MSDPEGAAIDEEICLNAVVFTTATCQRLQKSAKADVLFIMCQIRGIMCLYELFSSSFSSQVKSQLISSFLSSLQSFNTATTSPPSISPVSLNPNEL